MKILIDMNLSPFWVPFLARHQFEAWHWSTVGSPTAPDAEILDFARTNDFIILTHDLDFGMLLSVRGTRGPSVIQVRAQHVMPSGIGEIVVRTIKASQLQLKEGALVTIDPQKQRIRILPI